MKVVGFAGLLLALPTMAWANLVSNGSFELDAAGNSYSGDYIGYAGNPPQNWTYVGHTFNDGGTLRETFVAPLTQDGQDGADNIGFWATLRDNDWLHQSIGTVTDGASYDVSFWQSDQGNSLPGSVTVSLWAGVPGVGTQLDSAAFAPTGDNDLNTHGGGGLDGTNYPFFEFRTATLDAGVGFGGQPLYIQLLHTGDVTKSVLLDGVSVTVVPEPAGMALLALGGLAMIRRKR
ncbi:MAG: PEP-CTERM sorting domain-containing protein [Phycisphaeraceae bacterium]